MNTKTVNYEITWDELEVKGESKIPESLKPLLQDLYDDVQDKKSNVIGRLLKLIKKYPTNLQLKNYLSAAYESMGNFEKAMQVNDMVLKQNPDYLFARINKAGQFYKEGEYEKMQEILGKGFDLQTLYPDRDIFHITEFLAIQGMAVRYFSARGDLEEAENRLEVMKEMDEDAPQCELAEKIFFKTILEEGLKRFAKEREECITPKNQFHLKKKKFRQPEFNIPTTTDLYHYEFDIPDEILQEFFDHDRDQVIEDLQNVLKDSYYNYHLHDNDEYSEESFAPIHAFFLLGDLEAKESLPVVLEMMEQSEDYFDEVFGDIFTEAGWMALFKLGKNQLYELAAYLKLPGTYTYFRSGAIEALEQAWHHFPDKRLEVENIMANLLEYLIEATPEGNVIDSEFNGFFLWSIVNLKLVKFLPQIKKLYEKGYVSISVCGTFDELKKDIKDDTSQPYLKKDVMNIKELYDSFQIFEDPSFLSDPFEPEPIVQPIVHSSKKIGRNDPCPCGSEKKYKKCCLHKNIF